MVKRRYLLVVGLGLVGAVGMGWLVYAAGQPPVISNVAVSVTDSAATITWTTDQIGTSYVQYGTTTNYGSSVNGKAGNTSHTVVINNLASSTLYHYQLRTYATSTGSSGLTPDATFMTLAPPSNNSDVPAQYQALYNQLQLIITNLSNTELSGWNQSVYPVNYSVELSSADSQGGTFVLGNLANGRIAQELQRDKDMGVNTVETCIGFPYLDANFWEFQGESSAAAAATVQQWISFYQQVASMINNDGMKFIVEANPVFTQNNLPDPGNYYQSLSVATYEQRRSAMNVLIAQQIKPNYFIVQSEPFTDGQEVENPLISSVFNNPQEDTAMVSQFVTDLNNANIPGLHSSIQLGSGMGAWQPNWQQFLAGLTQISGLDKIDVHVYHIEPGVNSDSLGELDVASHIIDAAHAAGKGATIAEFWDHKTVLYWLYGAYGPNDPINDIRARDDFSFWAPLDQQFVQLMVQFANYKHLDYLSSFGTDRLSSYVDYNSSLAQTAPCPPTYPNPGGSADNTTCDNAIQAANTQAAKAVYGAGFPNSLSPSGLAYKEAAAQYAPTSPVPPPTVLLNVLPSSINQGGSAVLSWVVNSAPGLALAINNGIGNVANVPNNQIIVTPSQTTTYIITATNAGGTATAQVTVNVGTSPMPPASSTPTSTPPTPPTTPASTSPTSPTSSILELIAEIRSLAVQLLASSNNGRSLTIGSQGTDVWALQIFLSIDEAGPASAKLASITPTGFFGAITQAALAEYQLSQGIAPAYGYFGPITRQFIENGVSTGQ